MNKYIKRALKSLNISWISEEYSLRNKKDLDKILKDSENKILEIEYSISDLIEAKELMNKQIEILKDLKHQVDVEEYKDLNPGKNIF